MLPDKPNESTDVVEFVNRIYEDRVVHGVSVKECFMSAVNIEEVMRALHDRATFQATLHIPHVIEALAKKAEKGDVDSARLLFDVAGVSSKGKSVQNAIQINITSSEQAQLEKDFINGRMVRDEAVIDDED